MRRSSSAADGACNRVWKDMAKPSYNARCTPYNGAADRTYSMARDSVRRLYCGFWSALSRSVVTASARAAK
jgi:hypothetical protein